ncbi:hypothetical protein ANO11243_078310 [Dothideomycetidae sp. 11243]|nr:hypothetical protein ANO11243_078310 [fungal sp. No.11243]
MPPKPTPSISPPRSRAQRTRFTPRRTRARDATYRYVPSDISRSPSPARGRSTSAAPPKGKRLVFPPPELPRPPIPPMQTRARSALRTAGTPQKTPTSSPAKTVRFSTIGTVVSVVTPGKNGVEVKVEDLVIEAASPTKAPKQTTRKTRKTKLMGPRPGPLSLSRFVAELERGVMESQLLPSPPVERQTIDRRTFVGRVHDSVVQTYRLVFGDER